ncbi:MAG: CBS domain-containing protein [Chloroflexi bacterium]|nr:MAG: CBS domain-containing protein [Chloroflexota bacterium]
MIVRDIMSTNMITVVADDTLSRATNLLRQYQIHHLPVVRHIQVHETEKTEYSMHKTQLLLVGFLTTEDIDLIVALDKQRSSGDLLRRPWYDQRVAEVMHRVPISVTPTTSAAAAAQLLVERGINYLTVVEYEQVAEGQETQTILVGLLTRSDLLMALARTLGAFEPGMQLLIPLQHADLIPLAQTLLLAAELRIKVLSVMVAPQDNAPRVATLRLGTINPSPLLVRLHEANIEYTFADPLSEGETHA